MRVAEYETEEGPARQVVTYYYDVENRWIGQTIDRDGDGSVDHTRWFGYDGQQMLVQFDREGGGRLTAQDQSHRYLWGPAVDQILADEQLFPPATEEGTSASFPLPPGEGQGEGAAHGGGYDLRAPGRVLWPLADHLGTVRDLAQYGAASGTTTVVEHRQYDSFGNLASAIAPATNQAAAVDCLFGFTGRPLDSATGLQNNLNRWYDPAVGRWLSPDPLGLAAGDANLYRYCFNNSTTIADQSGLWGAGHGTNGQWQEPQIQRDFGHSDFYNPGGYFDFNKEDHGWTSPENPPSTKRHFKTLEEAEAAAEEALRKGDKDAFERALHQIQDYYSHRKQGWKAWNWDFALEGAKFGLHAGAIVGRPLGGATVGSLAGWGHTWPSIQAKLGLCPTPDDALDYKDDFIRANKKTKEWVERWRARWGEP